MTSNATVALPTGLIPSSRRPAVLADEVLVPASGSSMPEWLAYLQGRASGFADAWAITTRYRADDYVHYNQNIYRAIVDTEGVEPGSVADDGNVWTMVLDARLGPPRGWLSTAEIDDRIVALRPNPYTTADKNKLRDIEAEATADQTGDEITDLLEALTGDDRLDYESLRNRPHELTDALLAKLNGIEAGAQVNRTIAQIVAGMEALTGGDRLAYTALDGVPREKWRGNWNRDHTYQRADIVYHTSHIWICLTDGHRSTSGPDSDTDNWNPLSGYRGTWASGWYEPGDMTKDGNDGELYVCISSAIGSNGRPSSDATRWLRISNLSVSEIVTGLEALTGDARLAYTALDGTPAEKWRGDWHRSNTYQRADVTYHAGTLWVCLTNDHLSSTGPDGDANNWSALVSFRGNWASRSRYHRGNIVWHASHLWMCRASSLYSTRGPDGDTNNWDPITSYRGDWTNGWFEPGDSVKDTSDGQIYVCIASARGSGRPSGDATRWARVSNRSTSEIVTALEALTGDNRLQYSSLRGTPTIPRERYTGDWSALQVYQAGDVARYDGQLYVAVQEVLAPSTPPTTQAGWLRVSNPTNPELDARVAEWARANSPSGTAPPERLGTGDRDASKFLRDDGGWERITSDQVDISLVDWREFQATDLNSWLSWLRTYKVAWSGNLYWAVGNTYKEGELAVHNGSLWLNVRRGPQTGAGPHNEPGVREFGWGRIASTQVTEDWADAANSSLLIPSSKLGNAVDLVLSWAREGNPDAIPAAKLAAAVDYIQDWAEAGNTELIPAAKLGNAPATNLGYSRTASGLTVISSTGANVTLPLADDDHAGLMSPGQVEALSGPRFRGEWARDTAYQVNDLVVENNLLYRALVTTNGDFNYRPSTTATYWQRVADIFHGTWANKTYAAGSIVVYDGNLWMAPTGASPQDSSYLSVPGRYDAWSAIGGQEAVANWALSSNTEIIPSSKLPPAVTQQATNLSATVAQTYIDLESSTGDDVRIHSASRTQAGLMQASDYAKLADLPDTISGSGTTNIYRGSWYSSTTYGRGDIVYHADGFYVCLTADHLSSDSPSGDSDNWKPVSIYRGEWDTADSYQQGQIVKRTVGTGDDAVATMYIALDDTDADDDEPEDDADLWQRLTSLTNAEVDARIASWARAGQPAPSGVADGTVDSIALALSASHILTATVGLTVGADISGTVDLSGVVGGEENVQADWDESDTESDAYIANKPTLFEVHGTPGDGQVPKWKAANSRPEWADDDTGSAGSGEANVQADWDVTDTDSDAYIANKPTIPAAQVNSDWDATTGLAQILNKPTVPVERWKGDWSAGVYAIGDVVKDTWNNRLYFCISATTAADTSRPNADSDHWERISSRTNSEVDERIASWARAGQSAPSGSGGEVNVQADWDESDSNDDAYIQNKPDVRIYRGAWAAANSYVQGQLVAHSDNVWIAVSAVAANSDAPGTSGDTNWRRLNHLTDAEVEALINSHVATWAQDGDTSIIPASKLPASNGGGMTNLSATHNASDVEIASSSGDDATIAAAAHTPATGSPGDADYMAEVSTAGVMAGADKGKLDGIEAGATADQTGGEIADLLEALTGDARLPYSALRETPTIPGDDDIDARIADWAEDGNTDAIPASKLGNAPAATQANWTETDSTSAAYIENKPTIPSERFKGDWNGATEYDRGDLVYRNSDLWFCLTNGHTSTTAPERDSANWQSLANYVGAWAAGVYREGDVAYDSYDEQWYICIAGTDSTHGRPSSDANRWTMLGNPFRGNWQGSNRYQRGNIVWHDSHLWICRTNNHQSGWGPNSDSTNWDPITIYRGNWATGWFEPGDMVTDTNDGQVYLCTSDATSSHGRPSSDSDRWVRISNPTNTEIDNRIESWAQEGNTEEIPADKLPDQVQADWDETDSDAAAFIQNKPDIPEVPAGLGAVSLLGDWTIATTFTQGQIVGDTSPPAAADYVYTDIPSSGRVRITVCHTRVAGITEVPASCLRAARMDTRIGRIWEDGGANGFIAFYCDASNHLYTRQDIGAGVSNCRVIVQHIDDGLLPESTG